MDIVPLHGVAELVNRSIWVQRLHVALRLAMLLEQSIAQEQILTCSAFVHAGQSDPEALQMDTQMELGADLTAADEATAENGSESGVAAGSCKLWTWSVSY